MNFSTLTEEHITKRYDELPEKLAEAIFDEEMSNTVKKIALAHRLDDERTLRLSQLVALVLMGFVSRATLTLEITENLFLNYRHAGEIAEELQEKIFNDFSRELDSAYKPAEELETTWEEKSRAPFWKSRASTPSQEKKDSSTIINLQKIGETQESIKTSQPEEEKPLILHQEKKVETEEKPKFSLKGLSGFTFFNKTKKPLMPSEPAKARVETPKETPERVIHYNELRTPLTPFDTASNLIDLETFRTTPASPSQKETPKITLEAKEKEEKEIKIKEEKKEPFHFKFFSSKKPEPPQNTQTTTPLATLTSPHIETIKKREVQSKPASTIIRDNTIDLRY